VHKKIIVGSSFNGLGFPADYVQNSNLSLANTVTAAPPFFGIPQNFLNEQDCFH
jgi:hypothetical protein